MFHPFLLEEVTVLELIKLIAETFEVGGINPTPKKVISTKYVAINVPKQLIDTYLRFSANHFLHFLSQQVFVDFSLEYFRIKVLSPPPLE